MSHPKSILIVGPSWVGDMVMAHSLVQVLHAEQPGCSVDLLAPDWSVALVHRMPGVVRGLSMPVGHGRLGLRSRLALARELRGRYDQAIVLPNSWKSALIPFWARIPLRTGYLGELRFGLLSDWRRLDTQAAPMTVQRFAALGLSPHIPSRGFPGQSPPKPPRPILRVNVASARAAAHALGLRTINQVLILCPGAEYGPAKCWPAAHFAAVGTAMARQGWSVWVLGSDKDQEVAGRVRDLIGPECVNLAGQTSLALAVDLMALATAVVSNDSGLMHVAAALNRPLVAVYGSSDPGFTPPLNAAARIACLHLDCSPCFQRNCPQGHTRCLEELSPARVLTDLAALTTCSGTEDAVETPGADRREGE